MSEIPKIIHYCWFGSSPLPPEAKKCINSWKKYLPDYEIKRWDESNFDVNIIPYTKQAYENHKYAFVSDYARFWILYNYGGIYFDTDVEVIKSMDKIISAGPFMGCEQPYIKGQPPEKLGVNPGIGIGSYAYHPFYKKMLEKYSTLSFLNKDGSLNKTTIVTYTTSLLCSHKLINTPDIQNIEGIKVYPMDYFCPLDYKTGKLNITPRTVSIHLYTASWYGDKEKVYILVKKHFGEKIAQICSKLWRKLRY